MTPAARGGEREGPEEAFDGPTRPLTGRSVTMGSGVEFDLIRELLRRANRTGDAPVERATDQSGDGRVWLGAGDDAAGFGSDGWVVSNDLTIEDVHFRRAWISFAEVGERAVMVAASDLAAMAATPVAVLMSLAVAGKEAETVITQLADGVGAALKRLGAPLVGGDLSSSPGPLFIDVTAIGRSDRPVTRSGAMAGDEVWVTGVLGGSAGAVRAWTEGGEPSPRLRDAFARPTARTEEAGWLLERAGIRAMIDISDGLAGDLGHLAAASGVRLLLEAECVPLHPDLPAESAWSAAVSGGEDYELCFTCPAGAAGPLVEEFTGRFGIGLTRVGRVEPGSGVEILGSHGDRSIETGGFDHFSDVEDTC